MHLSILCLLYVPGRGTLIEAAAYPLITHESDRISLVYSTLGIRCIKFVHTVRNHIPRT